jgi:hypothetical protein
MSLASAPTERLTLSEEVIALYPGLRQRTLQVSSYTLPNNGFPLNVAIGFVAHVLTTLPASKLDNSVYRLQGDRATLLELAPIFRTTVEHVDKVPGPTGDTMTYLQVNVLKVGLGSTGWDANKGQEGPHEAGCTNALWEGHHWKSIKEVLNL